MPVSILEAVLFIVNVRSVNLLGCFWSKMDTPPWFPSQEIIPWDASAWAIQEHWAGRNGTDLVEFSNIYHGAVATRKYCYEDREPFEDVVNFKDKCLFRRDSPRFKESLIPNDICPWMSRILLRDAMEILVKRGWIISLYYCSSKRIFRLAFRQP